MADFDIRTIGAKEWIRAFTEAPQLVTRIVGGKLRDILIMLTGKAARYPAVPPGSRYIRTGLLGRGWTTVQPAITASLTVVKGRVGNATPYGPYVQSSASQAEIHRGRWETIEQIIAKNSAAIQKEIDEAGREIVQGIKRL
jgi:hypothetical protein